jgi:hypothetical protein
MAMRIFQHRDSTLPDAADRCRPGHTEWRPARDIRHGLYRFERRTIPVDGSRAVQQPERTRGRSQSMISVGRLPPKRDSCQQRGCDQTLDLVRRAGMWRRSAPPQTRILGITERIPRPGPGSARCDCRNHDAELSR